jgi:hypothetical protein
MRFYGLILLAQIACLIHAGRTGRPYFWLMIILFVPGLGILAYLAVEVIPGLLRGRAAPIVPDCNRLASIRHVDTANSRERSKPCRA